jgi:hypothetical protein
MTQKTVAKKAFCAINIYPPFAGYNCRVAGTSRSQVIVAHDML